MKKGFTLIELLVVITILGVLASIGFANFQGTQSRARDGTRKNDLRQLASALEIYYQKNDQYIPPANANPADCSRDTASFYTAIQPLMSNQKPPVDPSTKANYCYISEKNGQAYRLFAKLENLNDKDIIYCTNYNYTIFSQDLTSQCALGDVPLPTPTTGPTSTPAPTLTPTPTTGPTSTPSPTPSSSAIAFDTYSTSGPNPALPVVWNHTSSGTNRILIVHWTDRGASGDPTFIKYNNIDLTKIVSAGPQGLIRSSLWYLKNPTAGIFAISVTLPGAPGSAVGSAMSFTGVDQVNPIDSQASLIGSSNIAAVNITPVANNTWIVSGAGIRTAASETATVDPSQTEKWNILTNANGLRSAGSYEGPKAAAPDNQRWNLSAPLGLNWTITSVSLKPF